MLFHRLEERVAAPVFRRSSAALVLTLASLLSGACASRMQARLPAAGRAKAPEPAVASTGTAAAVRSQQPPPDPSGTAKDFTLRPGLVLRISVVVAGKAEFEDPAKRITASGTITLPLVGSISTEGETVESLGRLLTRWYGEYYVKPQVIVEFVPSENGDGISPWGYITVLGRVKNPGRYALPPTRDLTVSGAIQNAGGFDTSAKDSAIRVTRHDVKGNPSSLDVDLRAVGTRGQVQNDIMLQPGDVVFVPELLF